jgi:lipopolysaccharide biosynthesis glycosyltransferase
MERMNVVVGIDDKYTMPCGITLISLLENCKTPQNVDVYVIQGKNKLAQANQKKLRQAVESRNGRIYFKEIIASDYLEFTPGAYYSEAICYRIFAPRIFPHLKRVLYLDSDVLVSGDINEIYFTPLGNKYIGAVKDQGEKIAPKMVNHYHKIVGKKGTYFNSGLLLIDCIKWKKFNTEKKVIDYIVKNKPSLPDQDALNYVFNGKVHYLPDKWDVFFKNLIFNVWHFFDNPKGTGMIHFQSPYKPFKSFRITRYEYAYMKYMLRSPWSDMVPMGLAVKLLHPFFCIYLFFWVISQKIKYTKFF